MGAEKALLVDSGKCFLLRESNRMVWTFLFTQTLWCLDVSTGITALSFNKTEGEVNTKIGPAERQPEPGS